MVSIHGFSDFISNLLPINSDAATGEHAKVPI